VGIAALLAVLWTTVLVRNLVKDGQHDCVQVGEGHLLHGLSGGAAQLPIRFPLPFLPGHGGGDACNWLAAPASAHSAPLIRECATAGCDGCKLRWAILHRSRRQEAPAAEGIEASSAALNRSRLL
jgi:hypothetical protein